MNAEIAEYRKAQSVILTLKKQNYILWRQIRLMEVNNAYNSSTRFEVDENDQSAFDVELDLMVNDSIKDLHLKTK